MKTQVKLKEFSKRLESTKKKKKKNYLTRKKIKEKFVSSMKNIWNKPTNLTML